MSEQGWIKAPEIETNEKEFESVFWEPDVGDTLQGEILKLKDGKYQLFAVVEDDAGTVYKTPQHKDLAGKLDSLGVEEGDTVKMTYDGDEDVGLQYPKKLYTVLKYVGE